MAKRDHFRNSQRKRYQSRRFSNPYFQQRDKRSLTTLIPFLGGTIGLIVLLFFLFGNTRFNITRVSVDGIRHFSPEIFEQTTRAYLSKRAFLFFHYRNRFLFSQEEFTTHLETVFAFESIFIRLDENTLILDLVEKRSQLLWKTGGTIFVSDLDGILVRELSLSEREKLAAEPHEEDPRALQLLRELPVFADRNDVEVSVGAHVMSATEIKNIFRFHKHLLAQSIAHRRTEIDRLAGKWIGVVTEIGYDILFDATGDIDLQAANLETLLREKIDDPEQLDYIDLRFGDHLYFK